MKNGKTIYKTYSVGRQSTRIVEPQISRKTRPWPRWYQWLENLVDKLEAMK